MSSSFWSFCWLRSRYQRFAFTRRCATGSKESSNTGTKASAPRVGRRPSFYVMGASSALLVSAALALNRGEQRQDPAIGELLAHGWAWSEHPYCASLREGAYYEVENEGSSIEALVLSSGRALRSGAAWPEPPYACREILRPSFIEEIL